MTKVFVVRPFGNRKVLRKKPNSPDYVQEDFDFELVHKELIQKAMDRAGITGGTTGVVFLPGNIREDMFSSLLVDDLVIADITIYNANVFYELGIRHALRDKRTILIRCPGYDDTIFDIHDNRYVTYDKNDPAAAVDELIKTINDTLVATDRTDSPVFKLLPTLQSQDPDKFLIVPQTFKDDLNVAGAAKNWDKVKQLTAGAVAFPWNRNACRLIGELLFKAKAYADAMPVWEEVLHTRPLDRQANDRLSTIYQRLAEGNLKTNPTEGETLFAKSDLATDNFINNNELTTSQKAEAFSLKARNAKTRWVNSWIDRPSQVERQLAAIQSPLLDKSLDLYEKGFRIDLNHFYSGINVLGLLLVKTTLAEMHFDIWKFSVPPEEDARDRLKKAYNLFQQYLEVEKLSIQIARNQAVAKNEDPLWEGITEADCFCLTAKDPQTVYAYYFRALTGANELARESVIRQLTLYDLLGIRREYVAAGIAAVHGAPSSLQ